MKGPSYGPKTGLETVQTYSCSNSFEKLAANVTNNLHHSQRPIQMTIEVQQCEDDQNIPKGLPKTIVVTLVRGKYKTKLVDGKRVGFTG